MKKAFDQTFRDLKREVNKKVLKVPGIERKVLDATSNEAWGPHGSHLADIAQATRNYHEFQMIMVVIWKRINDTGKNWRHVYKALTVLEYLVAHGSERVIDEIREHAYQISTLSDFQYIDSSGRDQGSNVRRKSQSLVALVNSKERIQEVREKAAANKEKYRGGRTYRPDSHGHDDRFDDNHFEGRYRNRDEDRNGYERERDSGYDRYGRGGDSSSQDGDRYSRDFGERYRTEAYGDESYRGRGSDSYRFRSRSRSVDVDTDRSVDDDDRYSYRSGDTRADDHFQHERQLECKLSEEIVSAPPSYEEATRDAQNYVQDERDGGTLKAPIDDTSSLAAPKATSSKDASQSRDPAVTGGSVAAEDNIVDAFDEFDLRASGAAAPLAASSQELDIFGSLSAPDCANSMPLATLPSGITSSEADTPINSGFGTNPVAPSTSSATVNQPVEDPFGDSPFKATQEDFPAQPQGFTPAPSFQPLGSAGGTETQQPIAPTLEAFSNFNFGDTLDGITYAPTAANSQHSSAGPTFLAAEFPNAQENSDILADILPPTGLAAQIPSQAVQHSATTATASAQMNFLPQSGGAVLPQMSFAAKIPTQAGQPAAPTTIDGAQMDFIPCPWLSTPEAAPVSSQAACFAAPASMQAAEPTAPTTRGAQMNFLPYSKLSTPQAVAISSQTAHFAAPTSMQTPQPTGPITTHGAQMSFHPYSELSTPQSAPAISQTAHFADPASTQTAQPAASSDILPFQSVASAPVASQAASTTLALPPVKAQPSKFQPKSAVWADTLSRGLIDLNISGPKVNPLADIGIDFETMNRREKRKEMKSSATPATSTITMGHAMGAGSGIGRAGAGGLAPPPNPTINPGLGMAMGMGVGGGTGMGMGVGMSMGGYGWGMNQLPVGMGMGMNMGMGMGVNMGMGQGAHARPPTGLPPGPGMPPAPGLSGIGYNPMMGMGNYGSQQPYGGGYR